MGAQRPSNPDLDGDESAVSPRQTNEGILGHERGTNKTRRIETDSSNNLFITGTVVSGPPSLTLLGEYDGNSLLIYFADALPGTLTSALSWRIRKISYDGNGNFVSMKWANSLTTFSFSWDLRTTYTYA